MGLSFSAWFRVDVLCNANAHIRIERINYGCLQISTLLSFLSLPRCFPLGAVCYATLHHGEERVMDLVC